MDTKRKSSKTFLFLSSIIFSVLFAIFFIFFKESNILLFDTTVQALPIYEYVISSATQTKDILLKYGVYFSLVFLVLYLILVLITLLISKILTLAKYQVVISILLFIINAVFFSLGYWLLYYEPQIIPISVGIIIFIGKPLFYTGIVMLFISLVYILKTILHKVPKVPTNLLMLFMLLFLGGCVEGCTLIGTVMNYSCDNVEDKDHCYQKAAISSGNPDYCDNIEFGPPRDKCHMMIAMSKGDDSYCEGAEGNPMGYSDEFCKEKVAEVSSGSLVGTGSLTGSGTSTSSGSLSNEEQKKKNEDFRESKDKIFDDIEDDDVKVEIARQFNEYRRDNQDKSVEEWTKKMEDIAVDTETMKRLDDNANQLLDNMKSSMVGYVNGKTDEAKDAVLEEGWNMVKMQANTKELERRIKNLEGIKGAYDKASDSYNFINEKLEKIKKIKDEIEGIYKRMDKVNDMLKNDKIDPGQARVLKGAILLDEGLKNVTGYVPVFGSTISTISDETFNVVIKFASKRASRTHELNKCIDNLDNCDPNSISPY